MIPGFGCKCRHKKKGGGCFLRRRRVFGADQHKFVSALVIPEYKLLEDIAKKRGIAYNSRADLCANEQIVQFVMDRIETIQQDLASYEQVKRITLLPEPFSMERGELTNTLKVKRPVLNELYKEQIDKMYEE